MDMLWKQAAIERLKLYEPKRLSLKSIPQEIRRLELEMQSIRSATSDGSPSKGGGSGREDMYLSNIVRREELECSLEQARIWVSLTDSALSLLNDEERLLLDRLFIHQEKQAADRLAGDLHIDVKTVYRRKDDALCRFTVALYGKTEM